MDASIPLDEADHKIIELLSDKKGVILKNKSDLEKNLDDKELEQKLHWDCIDFSSKTTKGLSKLEKYITDSFLEGNISYNDQIYLTSVRHRDDGSYQQNVLLYLQLMDNNVDLCL